MVHAHSRRAATTQNGVKANSLSVQDWVAAANDLLVSENIRGVQIPALCRKLKVTKGSFYWHFSGREDLLRALLDSWRRRMTLNIYGKLGRISTGATSTLRAKGEREEASNVIAGGGRSMPSSPLAAPQF